MHRMKQANNPVRACGRNPHARVPSRVGACDGSHPLLNPGELNMRAGHLPPERSMGTFDVLTKEVTVCAEQFFFFEACLLPEAFGPCVSGLLF